MHSSNNLYDKVCVLCNQTYTYLVTHYATNHPNSEVFISRPSPDMVDRIKEQNFDEFKYDKMSKKITGPCYFCQETKSYLKHSWERHLLKHTGELLYFCLGCNTEGDMKGKHSECNSMYDNIYEMNDERDIHTNTRELASKKQYPLRCYICNHCNYTQINRYVFEFCFIFVYAYIEIYFVFYFQSFSGETFELRT